MAKSAVKILN